MFLKNICNNALMKQHNLTVQERVLINTGFRSQHGHYAFQQKFSLGGASWTFNPSKEAVNCKIKHRNNKLANVLAYNDFKSTKKRNNFRCLEIEVFKIYYSFLNHIQQSRVLLLVTLNILLISKKSYLAERFAQKRNILL